MLPNTEFVVIAIPTTENPIRANPNPRRRRLTQARAVGAGINNQPARATYIGHWPANSRYQTAVSWYRVKWNQYITLGCGASIYFNDVLNELT